MGFCFPFRVHLWVDVIISGSYKYCLGEQRLQLRFTLSRKIGCFATPPFNHPSSCFPSRPFPSQAVCSCCPWWFWQTQRPFRARATSTEKTFLRHSCELQQALTTSLLFQRHLLVSDSQLRKVYMKLDWMSLLMTIWTNFVSNNRSEFGTGMKQQCQQVWWRLEQSWRRMKPQMKLL